ncbi:hypothethical protein (plasmid) [Ralstonia solanacearum CMR15]|nr:hypothethical protein [Ralstonia solanacearum CMR15]
MHPGHRLRRRYPEPMSLRATQTHGARAPLEGGSSQARVAQRGPHPSSAIRETFSRTTPVRAAAGSTSSSGPAASSSTFGDLGSLQSVPRYGQGGWDLGWHPSSDRGLDPNREASRPASPEDVSSRPPRET